jgi:PTS system mannose-specific IIB component/fructoselysine and glucoselysine-specific PTS system IIB component
MPVVLYRIDERLIHGQVVMGWGPELRPEHYVVADDELAASEWEQDLYRLGLPEAATAEFLSVADAEARIEALESDSRVTIVLTRTISAMAGLAAGGALRGREVNVGGVHHAPGRTERLPYVFLSTEDEVSLKSLEDLGVVVSARDLPSSRAVGLASLLS